MNSNQLYKPPCECGSITARWREDITHRKTFCCDQCAKDLNITATCKNELLKERVKQAEKNSEIVPWFLYEYLED